MRVLYHRRMRDDLQQMRDKTVELEIKLDRVCVCGGGLPWHVTACLPVQQCCGHLCVAAT